MILRFVEDDTPLIIRINEPSGANQKSEPGDDMRPKRSVWKLKRPESDPGQDEDGSEQEEAEQNKSALKPTYTAAFFGVTSDTSFIVKNVEPRGGLAEGESINVSFFRGSNVYAFDGQIKKLPPGYISDYLHIEQESPIVESSRRAFDRSEMRINIQLFGIVQDGGFPGYKKVGDYPVFSAETIDISAGGFCLVSDQALNSEYEPNFLAEFSFDFSSQFSLPVVLVRKGRKPASVYNEYEYGFSFVFDNTPKEQDRLLGSILNRKLTNMGRF